MLVSTARNTGIKNTDAPMVLILDGNDRIDSTYIECVSKLLVTIQDPPPNIHISNTPCSFPPFTRLKMLILGGESYSDAYMYKKIVSYVQARRFVFLIHIGPE